MKKRFTLLTIVFLLSGHTMLAQDKHLTFNGIPISGHIRDIELRINAFTPLLLDKSAKDYSTALYSLPANSEANDFEPSDLLVYASGKSSTVWNISAYYPLQDDFESVIIQYLCVKDILSSVFGEAEDVVENGEKYSCWFNMDEGSISLEINKEGQLCADYFDSAGVDLYFDEM